ncbi:MAG: energy-coupling factor transporter transmembrane protein EcfT [Clostridia bacterium]|nr:energy-coupling factor transporter transmembrane protein EcfT [Clostridia bacterium]
MSRSGSLYIERPSIIHRLDGSTKLLLLIGWTAFIFMFMDIRIFSIMIVLGFSLLKVSKIPWKSIKPLTYFVVAFSLINSLILLLVTPQYGSELSGSYTKLISYFGGAITLETVWYAVTLSFKYVSILPITLLFVFTTHPSRFASSLNRIGVSYKVAYAVSIAFRYIPDVKEEMMNIMHAQEARGVAFRKGDASLVKRLRNFVTILVPLLISSLNRIEVVSNALQLRGFGYEKKRTWYNRRPLTINDGISILLMTGLIGLGIYLKSQLTYFWLFY